ncbi:LysR family transcriptional regulator [Rouxiella badensis]|jgi:DNA-binding transcriptional LysR family regulator|uniref:LysR family transcriptional regulator n=1 Tax=Rouxiella badensis TaxID=1646377 RepID=A0A1X0WHS1_9GAMM|nr:LysR family transcriptional regulator [Rouxiella badensis]MCC3746625.1 LysR family transcriptional regulator [Rouxiella badensis]ORJ26342.1 LysR family transcriptional regulator [Rouxiella badensis]QII37716.1 LysR family transcriptional regulator [Rouxiella badensis]WAT03569.1 LysR family transcriptional regulator [Rouxiella badensis]
MAAIDLKRLRAFVTVVEEGNITRAAQRLFIQQPPLTRLLQSLEEEFGVKLLARYPRGVEPTEIGRVLFQEAKALLERAENLSATMQRATEGKQGNIRIGFTSSAALHAFVPTVLRRYREVYPQVTAQLEESGSTELLQALVNRTLDVAFVRTPVLGMPELKIERILQEPMMVALPVGHPLAQIGDGAVELKTLINEGFILYRRPAGQGLYDAILAACYRAGFSPRIVQEAPRLTSCLSLVGAGLGVSIVPACMVRLGGEGVVYLPLSDEAKLHAPLFLAQRKESSAMIATFCALVKSQLDEMS